MHKNPIRGLAFSSPGASLIVLGFPSECHIIGLRSTQHSHGDNLLPRIIRQLVVTGIWQAGIGRKKVVAEGAWLVIAVGASVSTLGFLASNLLPLVSTTSGEFGIVLGIVGSTFLTGGVIKAIDVQDNSSTSVSTSSRRRKPVLSRREWYAFALLTVVLVAATAISISIYQYGQGSCTGCGCGDLVTPCPASEALNMESYNINSSTNVTLDIRNTGTASLNMVNYYVKDSAGDTYSSTNWSGRTVLPNALVHINIAVDGVGITFQAGHPYAITVITSRNDQFTFTVFA